LRTTRAALLFCCLPLGAAFSVRATEGKTDAPETAAKGNHQVLMIHSFGRDYPPFDGVASSFHTALAQQADRPVEFVNSSLQVSRFDGADREAPLIQYLKAIYPDDPPDLIVPVGASAGLFYARNRDQLFPDAPILLLGPDRRRVVEMMQPGLTAAGSALDLTVLIENMLQLLPETEHVYLAMGVTPTSQFWTKALLHEWRVFDQLTIHPLNHLSVDQMAETAANLPPNSVVLMAILSLDAAGIPHESGNALRTIRARSNSPVFGYLPSQVGQGIVGGRLFPSDGIAAKGATMAARILAGENPDDLTPSFTPFGDPLYDWREIAQWEISPNLLPPGSTILFRPQSLWEAHRIGILITLAVLIAQSILVILLLAARRRARESDARLNVAAEAAEIGLWNRDSNSDLFTASARCRSLLGFPPDVPVNLEMVYARFHPDDRLRVQSEIDAAAEARRGFSLETRILLPDGNVRWVALHGHTDPARNGTSYGTNGAVLDITDRKLAEAQAEDHRNEMAHLSRVSTLGALSGALAHELTQPLGSILHNAQAIQNMLKRADASIEEIQEIVDDIVSEDRRAADVIQRLRDLLRRGETKFDPVDLNAEVEETLRLMRVDLRHQNIAPELTLANDSLEIQADRVQIQQVLINLITNARDAMLEKPASERKLAITTRADDGFAVVSVRDCGDGVPADPAALFEPFQTSKPQGLGIGLVICRTLVSAHGGELQAANHPEGGAIFTVRIPLSRNA